MSVIIRLQNLQLNAASIDIRNFFRGLSIPDGGVHIVGGADGDAFIAFTTDEDARQALDLSGQNLKDMPVRLRLSSRSEMFKVIENARLAAIPASGEQTRMQQMAQIRPSNPNPSPPNSSQPLSHNLLSSLSTSSNSPMNNFNGLPASVAEILGLNLNGSANFLGKASGGMMQQAMNTNNMTNFPTGMGNNSHMSSTIHNGSTASQSASSSLSLTGANNNSQFNIPPPNMNGMSFPSMMSSAGSTGMSGVNSAVATMMNMGIPPPMLNMNAFQQHVSRAVSNGMPINMQGVNQIPQNIGQQDSIRPAYTGINPAFLAGGGMIGGPRPNVPSSVAPMRGRNPNMGYQNMGVRPASIRLDFNRDLAEQNRSSSHERRDIVTRRENDRKRRSRSRERDRNDRRRRSRSRSPNKGRPLSARRDSRERDDNRGSRRDSREFEPPITPFNTTDEQHPAIKLTGIPNEVSFREIKDFLRVDIMGGGDGTVRLYEQGFAYVKLEKSSDFPRAYRSNGRKLRSSTVAMEGIPIERWVEEYKLNKSRLERDVDLDRPERDSRDRHHNNRDRDDRSSDRERPDRGSRQSRFNSAPQNLPSCIVIKNLPPTVTSKDVSSRLLNGVVLADVVVSAGPIANNGRHSAIAHIKLDSPEVAQQAIGVIVSSQDGSNLLVEVSNMEDFNNAKMRTSGFGRTEPETTKNYPIGNISGDAKSIFDLEPGLDDESCSIMLKGAPANVSDRDVFDFFSDIGLMPMNVKVMYDTNGTCDGQVLCEFSDPHKARRATTKDGMMFGRGQVQVEMVPSGRKRMSDPLQNKSFRPSLLGPRPFGGSNARFGNPAGPNPFVQALQGGGPRPLRPRGSSRFGPRADFNGSNGVDRDDRSGGRAREPRVKLSQTSPPELDDSGASGIDFGKPSCVLALENVPYKASMDDILHHLSSILKLDISRERIIRRFDDSEKPTGDARVAFDSAVEAKLAHDRLEGTKMWNRPISYTIV